MSIRSFRRARTRRLERETRRARVLARRGSMLAGTTLTATALMAANAQAATPNTYVVQTSADTSGGTCNPSPGTCDTLRDAVNAANNDSGNSDTITFANTVTSPIVLGSPLELTNPYGMTISGPGASKLTISGGGSSQIFTFSDTEPATTTARYAINGLTLTDGSAGDNPGGAIDDVNVNTGTSLDVPVSLTSDVISHSSSTVWGGGIAITAPLTLNDTKVTGNTAPRGGGITAYPAGDELGKYGNLVTLTNHTVVSGNTATGSGPSGDISPIAGGGGILATGDALFVSHSSVTGNTSQTTGGGIAVASKYGTTITHSTVSGNTAAAGGGVELYGFDLEGPGTVHTHKYSPDDINATTISGNHARYGAGVHVYAMEPGNPVTIDGTTISANHGGAGSFGGGIAFSGRVAAPFQLVDSTISGNTAANGGGVSLGDGQNYPLIEASPSNHQPGSISFDNSTISQNVASASGGGIYLGEYTPSGASSPRSGTAKLVSTIVGGNYVAKTRNDLARASTSTAGGFDASFSLIEAPGGVPLVHNDPIITGKAPELGPLADNGGPTETRLPSSTSPVIDQGHNSLGLAGDQRGLPRKVQLSAPNAAGGDGTDIGSVELQTQSGAAPSPRLSATVGSHKLGGHSTPLLVGGRTPVSCSVSVGQLSSCVVEVRIDGYLVAAGGVGSGHATNRLSTTVKANRVAQRYLMKHYPHGVNAEAYVLSAGDQLLTLVGRVHLVP